MRHRTAALSGGKQQQYGGIGDNAVSAGVTTAGMAAGLTPTATRQLQARLYRRATPLIARQATACLCAAAHGAYHILQPRAAAKSARTAPVPLFLPLLICTTRISHTALRDCAHKITTRRAINTHLPFAPLAVPRRR